MHICLERYELVNQKEYFFQHIHNHYADEFKDCDINYVLLIHHIVLRHFKKAQNIVYSLKDNITQEVKTELRNAFGEVAYELKSECMNDVSGYNLRITLYNGTMRYVEYNLLIRKVKI